MQYSRDQLVAMLGVVQTFFLESERDWIKKNPKQQEPIEALMTEAWHTTFQLLQKGCDLDYNWVPGEEPKKGQKDFSEMFEKVPRPKADRHYTEKGVESLFRDHTTINGWTHLLMNKEGHITKVVGKVVGKFYLEASSIQIGHWVGYGYLSKPITSDRVAIFETTALSLDGIKSQLENELVKVFSTATDAL